MKNQYYYLYFAFCAAVWNILQTAAQTGKLGYSINVGLGIPAEILMLIAVQIYFIR
jgi:hypothetical protein